MDVFTAMSDRQSARVYLSKPVKRADVEEIFKYAGRAPSAINLQPWEYVIVYGEEKDRLVRRLKKAQAESKVSCGPGTENPLPDRFKNRSRQASAAMAPKIAEMGREFDAFVEEGSCSFYGAPIAIIVTIDRIFPKIRYLDVGLSVSYLLLAAQAKGLATCPIGLVSAYAQDIAEALDIPPNKEVILAIALGYADPQSPVNQFKTGRENPDEIRSWYE
ncbi:MAG: nitroreductase [Desulfobacterales bacterium]|jgi:nitroreductase